MIFSAALGGTLAVCAIIAFHSAGEVEKMRLVPLLMLSILSCLSLVWNRGDNSGSGILRSSLPFIVAVSLVVAVYKIAFR